MAHELAGTVVRAEDIIDVMALCDAYQHRMPDVHDAAQLVAFGTSGHRGKALEGSFNDLHVAAITQAICDGRNKFGANAQCFVGQDTHALSQEALVTVLEVLAGNGVVAAVDKDAGFVPTPSISRAILRYNGEHDEKADGIIITPSHNSPDCGGIKYNPIHGGPADTTITQWIETRANDYLLAGGEGIQRISVDNMAPSVQIPYDYKGLYVEELQGIVNMDAIKAGQLHILVNALGGSGSAYWKAIRDRYGLSLDIIHDEYDPTFSFMTYDHDGVIRMDCSSPYAMAPVIAQIGNYDLAVGNDPDYDRYGVVTHEGLLPANHFLVAASAYLFTTRGWKDKGIGKTVVVTSLVDAWATSHHVPVYEVPVGFKYFAPLLFDGTIGIGGEESAGASFLQKDGTVWTTDKDGIVMALLAMEMLAVTGKTPEQMYRSLTEEYGKPVYGRMDAPCSKEAKTLLQSLAPSDVTATDLNGEPIVTMRTTSTYDDLPIKGLYIATKRGWLVARPSGTEDLYKVYGESLDGTEGLDALLRAGEELVSSVIGG